MKKQFLFLMLCSKMIAFSQQNVKPNVFINQLNENNPLTSYSKEWNSPVFKRCNTASNANYMNADEQKIIWILNLIKINPSLFLKSVLLNPKSIYYKSPRQQNHYYRSLVNDLKSLSPNDALLQPDSINFVSAQCHAVISGQTGYVGHKRESDCVRNYSGECCSYGTGDPLGVVMQLLIDEGVPSLGHRKICLDYEFKSIGVSIQPHSRYGNNTVLDFSW